MPENFSFLTPGNFTIFFSFPRIARILKTHQGGTDAQISQKVGAKNEIYIFPNFHPNCSKQVYLRNSNLIIVISDIEFINVFATSDRCISSRRLETGAKLKSRFCPRNLAGVLFC